MNRYVRTASCALIVGYALQAALAYSVGYTFTQSLIPCEALRIRCAMTPSDAWVQSVARQATSFKDAEAFVTASIHYQVSQEVWGCERIPTIAETRSVGMRGDCKAIAVALGSVLQAKGIPFRVRTNYEHAWIEAE